MIFLNPLYNVLHSFMPYRGGEPVICPIPTSFFCNLLQERKRGKNRLEILASEALTHERMHFIGPRVQ